MPPHSNNCWYPGMKCPKCGSENTEESRSDREPKSTHIFCNNEAKYVRVIGHPTSEGVPSNMDAFSETQSLENQNKEYQKCIKKNNDRIVEIKTEAERVKTEREEAERKALRVQALREAQQLAASQKDNKIDVVVEAEKIFGLPDEVV